MLKMGEEALVEQVRKGPEIPRVESFRTHRLELEVSGLKVFSDESVLESWGSLYVSVSHFCQDGGGEEQ